MIRLSYHEKSEDEALNALGKLLEGHTKNDTLELCRELGTGTLQSVTLAPGLYIRIWTCTFNNQIELYREPASKSEPLFFTLTYYLTPQAVRLQDPVEKNLEVSEVWNTVFLCSSAEFKLQILPNAPFKCFSICFSDEWLSMQTTHMPENQRRFISRITNREQPVFFFESCDDLEQKIIKGIYDDEEMRNKSTLFLKSRVFTILHAFIQKSAQRRSLLSAVHNNHYEFIIHEVAKELDENVCEKLPDMKRLSKKFAISVSTLKRNFKQTYGKSMSEYHLDKKMEYAKQLVTENNGTISEIAYMLGYANVSQFIATFKKYNGHLPGSLRRGAA